MGKEYWIGWKLIQQPRQDDILTVKKRGVCKSEIPANLIWNLSDHILFVYETLIEIDETVEFLLNNKPIPEWIIPNIIESGRNG